MDGFDTTGLSERHSFDVDGSPLELALEAGEIGVWQWDVQSGRVTWSAALERIHGLQPRTFAGTFEAYQQDIHPDDRERVLTTIERSVQRGEPHMLEYRIVLPDGSIRWLEARGRLFTDAQDRPARLIGVCTDVSGRKRAEQALTDRSRLASLAADVGLVVTRAATLREMLAACTQAFVERFDVAFARIWTLNEAEQVLELQASSGLYTHIDGPHGRVPVGKFKIGLIAEERRPHLTNRVIGDPRVGDQEWAVRERMVSFAGYPLLVGHTLVGVLAAFARRELSAVDFEGLATVANAVAVGIARQRNEETLRESEQRSRQRADELARLATALERSNRELDQFAYVASHDLKAPLRGIANLSQWIEEDLGPALAGTTREHLTLLRGRIHRMEALIEGILEYSRAGRVRVEPTEVDTGRLVHDIIELIAPPPHVRFELDPQLPLLVTEKLPLQQVLLNLIGNAVKYTVRPDAVVRVSARRTPGGCEFRVSDNGPGIAPAFHDRVWGIFQTLEARDKVEGTGIGLALVKKIVEHRGGRAWVESEEGQGATFGFVWPDLDGEADRSGRAGANAEHPAG